MRVGVLRALPYACMWGRGWSGPFSIRLACSCTSLACQAPTLSLCQLLSNGLEALAWLDQQAQHSQQQLREAQRALYCAR